MEYFNKNGRRIPGGDDRVFGVAPSFFYRLNQPAIDYKALLATAKRYNHVPRWITEAECKSIAGSLLEKISGSQAFSNLLNGVKIPFATMRKSSTVDLGEELERDLLPSVRNSFIDRNSGAHFKATIQGGARLKGNVALDPLSRYEDLISAATAGPVVGWYFPQALQEYDVLSQRSQMSTLPELVGAKVCLSGGIDICAAFTSFPNLLISNEFYTPILCLSAYVHLDPRFVFLLKAYGPHMEFWCATQMLTPHMTQVSEQWTGGISIYTSF